MFTVNTKTAYPDEALRLQYFAGGKNKAGEYQIPKMWTVEKGWWHTYKPLGDDQDIVAARQQWGDPEVFEKQWAVSYARRGADAAWYVEWDLELQATWHKVMLQQMTPAESPAAIDAQWEKLQAEFQR